MYKLARILALSSVALFIAGNTFGGRPNSSSGHQAAQSLPIQLGTSGGWQLDSANGYCCGGTLGSLIKIPGTSGGPDTLHILSNFHVLAADVEKGENGITALIGDEIFGAVIQPALIDANCNPNQSQVAVLSYAADPLDGENIDAALARIVPGSVDPTGAILGIGELSDKTLEASVGLNVKKSGRTTGLTSSSIAYVNTSVSVQYENECAGSEREEPVVFTGQIFVSNSRSRFLAGGDSGSLLVENRSSLPRAIGLLFAGSSQFAIANPIDEVLTRFNATMVGSNVAPDPDDSGDTGETDSGGRGNGRGKKKSDMEKAKGAQKKASKQLLAAPKGVGHGIGRDKQGKPFIAVFVESLTDEAVESVPSEIDGVPVQIVETGKIVAF